jgi:diguanylate cyclase (GGDEF)-like protein
MKQSVLIVVIAALFALLFVDGAIEITKPPRFGIAAAWNVKLHAWQITNVRPLGLANGAGVESGDVVLLADGETPSPPPVGNENQITEAVRLRLQRVPENRILTVNARDRIQNHTITALFSVVFFAVGLVALIIGEGTAPKALALVCIAGAAELAILPTIYRDIAWSIGLHTVFLPLFFSGFAYLFLVFPRDLTLRLGKRILPTWLVPLTSLPIAIVWSLTVFVAEDTYKAFQYVIFLYFISFFSVGLVSLLTSWFRTREHRARVQIRLIVLGTTLALAPFILLSVLPEALFNFDLLAPKFSLLPLVLMPLSFAYAILRYQVMDLQLFIRRGIVYSVLALCVTGTYAVVLFVATTVVQDQFGRSDVAVLAISGTIVALIFQSLRDWLQRHIDLLFDRNYYDYRNQLLEFSQQMTEILVENDLGTLTAELVMKTMGPMHVRVYNFDALSEVYHCISSVGIAVPAGLEELTSLQPIIQQLNAAGGLLQLFDAEPDGPALTILLRKKADVVGLLMLGPKKADLPYSSEDISLMRTVANQLAVALDNARLYQRTRELYLSSIRTLAATVDAKDPYTHGHSERVSAYSRSIAVALGLSHEDIESIELAGLLHDIGKIGIPDAILQKPGRLDPDERDMIMEHAALGAKIISENASLMPLAALVRHHHEWFNGNGYPDGLSGYDIPLGAAIISVADTFDTMTTDRPYRAAPGKEKAMAELERCSGTQFRPEVVKAFLETLRVESHEHTTVGSALIPYSVTGRISPVDTRAMRIIYRVVQMIGDVTEIDSFVRRVISLIQREIGTGSVDIYFADVVTGELVSQTRLDDTSDAKELRIAKGIGLIGWAAAHGVPARVDDAHYDSRGNAGRYAKTRSQLVVPLVIEDKTIGVIDVQSRRTGSFTADDEMLLVIVAQQLAQVIEVAQLHDQLKKNAILDGLTGVANHRFFYQRLEEELARSDRSGEPVSLLLLDVDGLNQINATYGHVVGDAALRTIGALLQRESRSIDIVARYGGDEFAIILPGVDADGARSYANRVARTIELATFESNDQTIPLPSVSWGRATLGVDGDRAVALVAAADARMYRDKFDIPEPTAQPPVATSTH